MRNQSQSSMAELLDLQDELNQHLAQAKALVTYMGADLNENQGFTVTDDVIDGMLWTVRTLLDNAETVSDKISKWHKQRGGNNEPINATPQNQPELIRSNCRIK